MSLPNYCSKYFSDVKRSVPPIDHSSSLALSTIASLFYYIDIGLASVA
jgi:hypothetical protein